MKRLTLSAALIVLGLTVRVAQAAITLETVSVGNPGNANDTTGYGAVGNVYNIGKYEVTAEQYTAFLNAVATTDTYGLYSPSMADPTSSWVWGCNIQRSGSPGSYSYSVAPDWANRPVNWVSVWDAARFANWLHNGQPTGEQGPGTTESGAYHDVGDPGLFGRNADARYFIPTENEWYKAAYHKNDGATGNYWDYPTSSDSTPSNVLGSPTDPGNNATFDYGGTIGSPYWRTEVGAHENSESPYGTFDQAGNLFEWNENAVIRGGSFMHPSDYLLASRRDWGDPAFEFWHIGFRMASNVPEPASIIVWSMIAGLGLAFAWWRKRKAA